MEIITRNPAKIKPCENKETQNLHCQLNITRNSRDIHTKKQWQKWAESGNEYQICGFARKQVLPADGKGVQVEGNIALFNRIMESMQQTSCNLRFWQRFWLCNYWPWYRQYKCHCHTKSSVYFSPQISFENKLFSHSWRRIQFLDLLKRCKLKLISDVVFSRNSNEIYQTNNIPEISRQNFLLVRYTKYNWCNSKIYKI